ncbi:hypothetical protein EI555_020718 [Monodon monoceros]|uniref:Tr-type G domain-containing protein n=1 Tax=Monodon monoceros TaxID=40151 RepID=A0A4U1EC94_MONMO|nr:hypothetical protein EI555_020718 [Monodon monoceros]
MQTPTTTKYRRDDRHIPLKYDKCLVKKCFSSVPTPQPPPRRHTSRAFSWPMSPEAACLARPLSSSPSPFTWLWEAMRCILHSNGYPFAELKFDLGFGDEETGLELKLRFVPTNQFSARRRWRARSAPQPSPPPSTSSRERSITLDLGFSCFSVPPPARLRPAPLGAEPEPEPGAEPRLQVTLVDCPGHASLIRTIIGECACSLSEMLSLDPRDRFMCERPSLDRQTGVSHGVFWLHHVSGSLTIGPPQPRPVCPGRQSGDTVASTLDTDVYHPFPTPLRAAERQL